ncbi:hypothetical protein [Lacrimispora indolis]|uniref:hypothetical protein n=1 Tax=Lacrimispora indolis TaxID=69825 RepID=UPI0004298FD5|nr:hypothetical protein [[Clostridium] methoxybenzovorans]
MNEYLVTMGGGSWNNIFIVSAKDSKDAINQVFDTVFKWKNPALKKENEDFGEPVNHIYSKTDLTARSIGSLHNEEGKIITVN